jgi:protein-tyrosine phosphatase
MMGMMTTIDENRILPWEGVYNARDLGGYPTADGGETRWHRIVRSDNLARLTEAGKRALIEYGIRTIIDLRLPEELEAEPPPFRDHETLLYHNISLVDPAKRNYQEEFTTLANDYVAILEQFRSQVAETMTTIARAPEGGVLIHCHAGKDRTGITSAILLRLAGVSAEIAAQDYALTSVCLRPLDEEWIDADPTQRAQRQEQYEIFRAREGVMDEVLEHLEAAHGSVERYLLDAGVTPEDVERLRRRLRN